MAEAAHQFGNITLAGRGGVTSGLLRISNGGFSWRRHGSDKPVVVKKEEITGVVWTLVGKRGGQLGVRRAIGPTVNFMGFKPTDKETLATFCKESLDQELIVQDLAVNGRNWGALGLNGSSLSYKVDEKVMFEVPLPDVSQAQQTKDEVLLEFHVDDTVDDREDTLIEIAFHVPAGNPDWAPDAGDADGEDVPKVSAAKALVDALLQHTDAGAATSDDAVITFQNVALLAPRGRFQVEMHLSYLQLVGQTQDFKIRYTSIGRLFILPKSSTPHTLVVIGLDPPIRKGQTYYSYLLCQFENGDDITETLDISEEDLEKKNKECGGKLHKSLTGPQYQVFAHALRGLSSAKITRARNEVYQNHAGDGCAVRCSYKADDGFLYPLEKAFFYVHKPPMCINHNDIEHVEFQRQGTGAAASSVRTFDLLIKQKSVSTDFLFRGIQRSEWEPLFNFINQRKIRIENLAEARQGPRGPAPAIDFGLGEDEDAGFRAARAEADEEEDEDEDFDAGGEDMSESSDGSLAEGEEGSDDAEMVDEEGIDVTAVMGEKPKKRKAQGEPEGDQAASPDGVAPKLKKERAPKKPRVPKPPKTDAVEGDEGAEGADGKKQRKPRKKKDPNAPKKALSAFMFFSNANRERVKAANPGVAFGQVGKLLGEEWKTLNAEDKAPYEAQAAKDKERYAAAMAEYKAAGGGAEAAGAADEGDAGDEDVGEEP